MTKTIALILAAVLLVGGGVTVGVVINNNNNLPQNVARDAILSLADVVKRTEIAPLYKTITGGSIQMSQTFITEDGITSSVNNSAKIYFAKDKFVAQNVSLSEMLPIQGDLWIDDDFVYVKEQNFLGGAYALEKGKLADQFEKSIFAYGSQSKYALDNEDKHDDLVKLLSYVDSLSTSTMEKDMQKISYSYLKELWNIFCEEVSFESQTKMVKIDSNDVKARSIKITINANDICDIWERMLQFLREDEQVVNFLEKHEDLIDIANNPIFGSTITVDRDIASKYIQLLDQLNENMDVTCQEILEQWENNNLIIDITTPTHSSKMLKLRVSYGYEDKFILDFDNKTIENANKITLKDGAGNEYVYQVVNGDQTLLLTYSENGERVFSFNYDRESTQYTLTTVDQSKFTTTSKGTIVQGKDITMTVNEVIHDSAIYDSDDCSYTTDLTFILKTKDKLPQKPNDYKTLATITEEDIDNLLGGTSQMPE